jgi:hypothetical protein
VRVSQSGGTVARWSPNGRELLYRTDAHQIMSVTYRATRDVVTSDAPRPWSPLALADTGVLPNFDVAPGGERVLALMPSVPADALPSRNHVTVVLNVFGRSAAAQGPSDRWRFAV